MPYAKFAYPGSTPEQDSPGGGCAHTRPSARGVKSDAHHWVIQLCKMLCNRPHEGSRPFGEEFFFDIEHPNGIVGKRKKE